MMYAVKITVVYSGVISPYALHVSYFCHANKWDFLNEIQWSRENTVYDDFYKKPKLEADVLFKSKFHANFVKEMYEKYDTTRQISVATYEVIEVDENDSIRG